MHGPRPLALYFFGPDKAEPREGAVEDRSGGVTVNDTLLHVAAEGLPFGGVGPSGMGAYHGEYRVPDLLAPQRPYSCRTRINGTALLRPPYGRLAGRMLKFMLGR